MLILYTTQCCSTFLFCKHWSFSWASGAVKLISLSINECVLSSQSIYLKPKVENRDGDMNNEVSCMINTAFRSFHATC